MMSNQLNNKMFKLWRFYEVCTFIVVFMGFFEIFRAMNICLGAIDLVWLELAFTAIYTSLFCLLCLYHLKKININQWSFIIFMCIGYPFVIGIFNQNYNVTFIMDSIIYLTFFVKLSIFGEFFKLDWFRKRCHKFLLKMAYISAIVGMLSSLILIILSHIGYSFYYSTTSEITYGFANSLISGNILSSLGYAVVGFMSGKRMIVVGLLLVFVLAYKRYIFTWKMNLTICGCCCVCAVFLFYFNNNGFLPLYKITSLFNSKIVHAISIQDLLKNIDKHRYNEVIAILHSMDNFDYVFGKGYGFRYIPYDNPELISAGITFSNSHFSPMGIVSKFGIWGLVLFYMVFLGAIIKSYIYRNKDPYMYMVFICLVAYIFQAFFAYILFNNVVFLLLLSSAIYYRCEASLPVFNNAKIYTPNINQPI